MELSRAAWSAFSTSVAHAFGPAHSAWALRLRSALGSVEVWPLHLAGSTLRTARAEIVAEFAPHHRPHPLPCFHPLSHRHRSLRAAALHSAIPQIAAPEVRALIALRKTMVATARLRAVVVAASLSLCGVAMGRRFRPILPRGIARPTLVARTIGASAIRRGTARMISIPSHFTTRPLRLVAIAGRTFRTLLIATTLTARAAIPLPLTARALIPRAAMLAAGLRAVLSGTTAMIAVPFHFPALSLRAISVAAWALGSLTFPASTFRALALLAGAAAFAATGLRPTFAGAASFPAGLLALAVAGRAHLIGSDAAVAVAVELAQEIRRMIDFLFVDLPVVIGVERAEDSRHGSLGAAAGCAFAAWSAFALRLRRALRWVRLIFLREERRRREGECHCGEESSVLFHGLVQGCDFGGCCRGMRRAFTGQNATRSGFCLRLPNIYTMHRWR